MKQLLTLTLMILATGFLFGQYETKGDVSEQGVYDFVLEDYVAEEINYTSIVYGSIQHEQADGPIFEIKFYDGITYSVNQYTFIDISHDDKSNFHYKLKSIYGDIMELKEDGDIFTLYYELDKTVTTKNIYKKYYKSVITN